MKRILGGTGAAVAAKLLTGFAVVAFAAAGAGAATEAAISGSLNPTVWGQQVKQQVATCKAALTPGQHGIGDCVSEFSKQHGETTKDQHLASPARENPGKDPVGAGKSKGNGNTKTNGNTNTNGNNKGGKETGQPPIHENPPSGRN